MISWSSAQDALYLEVLPDATSNSPCLCHLKMGIPHPGSAMSVPKVPVLPQLSGVTQNYFPPLFLKKVEMQFRRRCRFVGRVWDLENTLSAQPRLGCLGREEMKFLMKNS